MPGLIDLRDRFLDDDGAGAAVDRPLRHHPRRRLHRDNLGTRHRGQDSLGSVDCSDDHLFGDKSSGVVLLNISLDSLELDTPV